jgi:pSer/pThr/pTyr-binding forkhead associated (FHA) protein
MRQNGGWVFPPEARGVSKRHGSVRYDPDRKVVMLEDAGSSYGTFLESGERLRPGAPLTVRGRIRFYVGEPEQLLGLEVSP